MYYTKRREPIYYVSVVFSAAVGYSMSAMGYLKKG